MDNITTSNNANLKEPKKKGRKPYQRDENGNIIRPANKTKSKKIILQIF